MEATKKRKIKNGIEYDHLFPRPKGKNKTIKRDANLSHTVVFIPKVVTRTLDQTKHIAKILKGKTVYETCSNIWDFVYGHINYDKDRKGYEQIRSPARTWHDRKEGVDCDCYSVFISSILTNVQIPHILRITKYRSDQFQHIYPVVPYNGRTITIDCVTDQFNYEVPYSEKKDYPMDLQYLNGFDGDGMEELGKIIKRNMAKKSSLPKKTKKAAPLIKKLKAKKAAKSNPTTPKSSGSSVPAVKKKKKGLLKKVVSKINKINPATILLRNGVLASMKLNVKNVAGRLRWSYLTAEQAAAKGIMPEKFQKLIAVREKLENIFTTAGGKADNLKKAILGGKGNKDKAVSGLGMLPMIEWSGYMNEYTPLDQLLGPETYYSENIEGMQGLGELGEPVTLTSIAAAAGVIAGIVGALKQIGDIFGGKGKGSEDFDESKTDAENNINNDAANSSAPLPATANNFQQSNPPTENSFNEEDPQETTSSNAVVKTPKDDLPESDITENDEDDETAITKTNSTPATDTDSEENTGNTPPPDKKSFWDKNKNWLKPVAIGAGGLTLVAIGFHLMKGNKTQNKSSPAQSLSGVPPKKKSNKRNHHRKTKHQPKKAVALV
ncbi:MAG TPA: transglutaminase-like domain-containing protein [Chitinophagaceae bacterium]|jgi:hypothetical protein|nr:transglutaminase-like domain-containing protein [Chitinophagaceae bacterium]